MILKNIAKAIKQEKKNGTSLYRISKDTGIDQAALSRLKKETEGCISIKKADILCKYLGLELTPKQPRKRG
jgi:DNA-binding Xre family transcriptional regulator